MEPDGVTTNDVDRTAPLHTQIDAIERRLATDRNQLGADLRGIARKLRAKVVAPGSIMAAVALGVIIEQGSRHRTWSLAPVLQGLTAANSLVVMVGSLVKSLNVAADD
jgi:hypothetical protein